MCGYLDLGGLYGNLNKAEVMVPCRCDGGIMVRLREGKEYSCVYIVVVIIAAAGAALTLLHSQLFFLSFLPTCGHLSKIISCLHLSLTSQYRLGYNITYIFPAPPSSIQLGRR